MKQLTASVISNTEITQGMHLVWLDAPEIASEARPGQFIMVGCKGDTTLPRPLSINQSDGSKIAILFKIVGKGTSFLSNAKAGDRINVFGPAGNGYSILPGTNNLLLIAGGIGIAPLHFLAQEAKREVLSVTIIAGAKNKDQVYPERRLPFGIKLIVATDDGTMGHKGLATQLIPGHLTDADQVFACGPLPMYRAMTKIAGLKTKPVQVSLEAGMACGRGICYGCTIKTRKGLKKVCEDGPVFDMNDIIWDDGGG